eukprot:CAMPEP_0171985260 /NCGR_PEP_ID=MMETSP0993-20121228/274256_1 /TAXON_ID=483369 /ORGANISM="non described non described, Strain CCMP2098" /LENGTH=338 /DNA_ID=CAMNT_0012638117 /DNA_START=106 /DNA_END=1123 /DNA_ORIENTATION=+
MLRYYLVLVLCFFHGATADTGWVLGDQGADCGATCAKTERVCSGAEGATLTTNELVGAAFAEAGYTCLSYHDPRDYAGTPFSKETTGDDCAPFIASSSKISSCSENAAGHHTPLCYCKDVSPNDAGSCFHASGTATLESGASKKMPELSLGDVVQIADEEGNLSFSQILMLPHKKNDEPRRRGPDADEEGNLSFSQILMLPHKKNDELATFLNLTTESGKTTLMTADHLIPRCGETIVLSMASELFVGDCLLTTDGKETLTEINSVVASGIYTAVTKEKFIVVDGIVASPFSRDSDRDHSMREYEEFRKVLENKQKLELGKTERKQRSIAAKRLLMGK